MINKKSSSRSKGEKYSSFEEMKAKLFPGLVTREEQKQKKHDPKQLGVLWANESIDSILSKSN